jgi:hypothetical protein
VQTQEDPLKIGRRQFLAAGAALPLIVGASEAAVIGEQYVSQLRAFRGAARPNDEWLADNDTALSGVTLGASFAPEQWSGQQRRAGHPMAALRFLVDELAMRDVRLGIRWSRVDNGDGNLDLRPYLPYLEYCFDRGLDIALNVGPIKVFRWPENHVPAYVRSSLTLPPARGTVTRESDLGQAALAYLDRLLRTLQSEFGARRLASVRLLQTENEAFYPLGVDGWNLSNDYLDAVVEQAEPYFPGSSLLLTSAGRLNMAAVQTAFRRLVATSDAWRGRLVMGFDYHFQTPFRASKPIVRHLDPITFANPWTQSTAENRKAAGKIGYRIEVTEAQAEPNGPLTAPGNDARLYRFMLKRCIDEILVPGKPGVIRIWGVEEMAKHVLGGKPTGEHLQIVDLTRRINQRAIDTVPPMRG